MKKIAFFALTALALMACQREVIDPQESTVPTYTVTITARLEATRTAYDDAGKFSWVAGDKINVLVSNGTTKKQVVFTTTEAGPEVKFTGEVDEGFQVAGEAAYALDFDASKQKWVLPQSVTVDPEKPLSSLPLFGAEDASEMFQFKTATGILKFTVENAPVETAQAVLFTMGNDSPALWGGLDAAPADGIVTLSALTGGGQMVFSNGAPAAINTTMTYWFFVPAGTLPADKTTFAVCDAEGNIIRDFRFKKDVEVAVNRITNVAPVHFEPVKVVNRQTDSLALVAIYNAADGANWKESRRWTLEKPMDTWPGIKLDKEGRVIEMSITNGTVTTVDWEIPAELAELTALQTLQIVGSKLKGEIPAWFYDMTSLAKVRLNSNNLTGSLSEKLGQLTELTELYINLNKQFAGNLPSSIGQLQKLESINIAQTAIGGEIPQSLSQCKALKNFMAWNNQLSGEIPDFWDQLPNIGVLQLYGNPGLTGNIPASIGTLKSATGIQLKECNLTGNIPASFGGLEKCINLQLNGNKLSGVVPAEVQAHPKWQATTGWKYETNILPQQEGYELLLEAPTFSRQTDSLALVKIYNIADGANWKASRRWTLTEPMDTWPGIKLDKEGRVIEMSITNGTVTSVEWEIPAALADLTELSTLQIVGSKLKGEIPAFLYDMTKLAKIRFNTNDLTGEISDKIGQWTELTELYLNGNKDLGGGIPKTLGQLKKLVSINIAQTAIGGALPAELSGCESLQNFMAYETAFTSIPDNWDQWPALKIIQLYGCKSLECPLPASIGNMKNVTSVQLKNGNFTGNIPESYANLPTTCSQLFLNGNKLEGVVPAAVQAHSKWQLDSGWKYGVNILPQQEGFGLTTE